jgi:hypothetical protein
VEVVPVAYPMIFGRPWEVDLEVQAGLRGGHWLEVEVAWRMGGFSGNALKDHPLWYLHPSLNHVREL